MCQLLLGYRKPHTRGNVPRVYGNCSRMASCVPIARVKRGNEGRGERQTSSFELLVGRNEIVCQPPLFLIKHEEPLRRKCWYEKEGERPGRQLSVGDRKNRDERRVKSDERHSHRHERPDGFSPSSVSPSLVEHRR